MQSSTVLITGVNGFIGSRVALAFLEQRYAVAGIDRGESAFDARIRYYQADITDAEQVQSIFSREKAQRLVHLAALVHKKGADLSLAEYRKINAQASAHIFRCAKDTGVKTVLFASTIEVYGESSDRVVTEETPCNPKSYYAVSKHEAETALYDIKDAFERYAVMRFAPVYAKDFRLNLDKRFYLPQKIAAYVFKDGAYSFNFCAVGNAVDFMLRFAQGDAPSGIYNISDSANISAHEFIAQEKRHNGLRRVIRMPYGLCYAGVAAVEGVNRVFSRSEPFFSRYNFKKLFASTVYSNAKATAAVGPFEWDLENTLYEDNVGEPPQTPLKGQ